MVAGKIKKEIPLTNMHFQVLVNGIRVASFSKVSGLRSITQVREYRQGGRFNYTVLPEATQFEPIRLERGVTRLNTALDDWRAMIFHARTNPGMPLAGMRRDLRIRLYQKASRSNFIEWQILKAWPSSLGESDFDALGNTLVFEDMILQNEGQYRVGSGIGLAEATDAAYPFQTGLALSYKLLPLKIG